MKNKFGKMKTIDEAMEYVKDGCTIMIAGFGGIGSSYDLIQAIIKKGVKDLTLISIDAGDPDLGPDHIVANRQCKKLITSHIGATKAAGELLNAGELEVEFCPQGTLAERIRAGGVGIPGFLTDIGLGTIIEQGKQKIRLEGREYLLETALKADVAIILAEKADEFGNLVYSKTARGLNPLMARAAEVTIVDAKQIVPLGEIDPEDVVTPGAYVDIIVHGGGDWKWSWQ
ncbi:CoA transferase subunit A [Clostridium aminobutyricum]|uniref:CoA transferase subunit A n=1 Tax=Clostridium aminobutyricum TaxID=33953 RepID=A0A939D9L1_CLOAM|nr:CoA transferase subunit A [Clostridium aminobutyricum]MBN7773949.1 CoA transferase subunit A [Clostridium aminobutyricum]